MQLTCRVGVTQGGVQEDVSNAAAPDVDGLGRHVSEDDAIGVNAPGGCLGPYARLPVGRESQQPQNRLRHPPQNVAPGAEGLWVVLQRDTAASWTQLLRSSFVLVASKVQACARWSAAIDSAKWRDNVIKDEGGSQQIHLVQLVGAGVHDLVIWQPHL